MPVSTLGWDDPAAPDKYLQTWQRTISSTATEAQIVVPGEHFLATYSALSSNSIATTSASHLIALEADGTNYIRIHRIWLQQRINATSATLADLQLLRTTTASSGGVSLSARPYDFADTNPYGGAVRVNPTSKGTEGNLLLQGQLWLTNAIAANPNEWTWTARADQKPIIVGNAVTEGVALKIITGISPAGISATIEFSLSAYL